MSNHEEHQNEHEELELPVFDNDLHEKDNPIPQWWWTLWATTIGFALGYFVWFHMLGVSPSLAGELAIDVQNAKIAQEIRDREMAAKMEATMSPAEIGKKYFKTFCASCHGNEGEGNIGPNFHDNFFIHEPTPAVLTNVVANGVAAKGMPAWGSMLGDRKVKALVAYVSTLHTVPLTIPGKAAEGKEYGKEELTAMLSGAPATPVVAATDEKAKTNAPAVTKAKPAKKDAAPAQDKKAKAKKAKQAAPEKRSQ